MVSIGSRLLKSVFMLSLCSGVFKSLLMMSLCSVLLCSTSFHEFVASAMVNSLLLMCLGSVVLKSLPKMFLCYNVFMSLPKMSFSSSIPKCNHVCVYDVLMFRDMLLCSGIFKSLAMALLCSGESIFASGVTLFCQFSINSLQWVSMGCYFTDHVLLLKYGQVSTYDVSLIMYDQVSNYGVSLLNYGQVSAFSDTMLRCDQVAAQGVTLSMYAQFYGLYSDQTTYCVFPLFTSIQAIFGLNSVTQPMIDIHVNNMNTQPYNSSESVNQIYQLPDIYAVVSEAFPLMKDQSIHNNNNQWSTPSAWNNLYSLYLGALSYDSTFNSSHIRNISVPFQHRGYQVTQLQQ
ncbi:hypothetical protein BDB01DRAFT_893439 [Pilobolus umbonatus]|nr:hypothetical protein BDB01DRAFT_893439 [Pilobolus umbonatus]